MATSMIAAQICGTVIDQAEASVMVLAESQNERFPYRIQAFGLEIEVHPNVFSPKHFHGWEVFTRHFPRVVGERVLEIGSGTGITAVYLAKRGAREVVAVDINPQAVENTRNNARLNRVTNLEARVSDVFFGIDEAEKFDAIYWNLPFIYMPPEYRYRNILERGLFDPGYMYTERFLAEASAHLAPGGRILVGLADFADLDRFMVLATKYRYRRRLVASEPSVEVNPVDFRLYELRPFTKVFYAMPFTGRSHGEIVASRAALHRIAEKRDLDLLEQFVGVEEEDKFESHGYLPLFIAKKDHDLLAQADLVVVDYSGHSIGRDCETVIAKEVMDKRIIAVVPDSHVANWLRSSGAASSCRVAPSASLMVAPW
ncbi:MAG: methyltransferase [Pseudomonadota bacterium]|nr:methyltransferase [Pseudomonadota bacterium]